MAIQFCKFQETLFRKVVLLPVKINALLFCYTLYNYIYIKIAYDVTALKEMTSQKGAVI
jgi:hypothetical protein